LSREVGEARRREIAKEVEGYLTPAPKAATPAPAPAAPPVEAAPPVAPPKTDPGSYVPLPPTFRWDEEMRFLLYVAIGVSLVAAVVAGVLMYQG
jgi:hypothetical protein